MTPHLFVYGTLLPKAKSELGTHQRARLAAEGACLGEATARGMLVWLGDYPGMRDGAGTVHGALYELWDPANTLRWLDEYEGVTGTQASEYDRREIQITQPGGATILAWAYIAKLIEPDHTPIASGRWLDYEG